jgi:hypothetical protein
LRLSWRPWAVGVERNVDKQVGALTGGALHRECSSEGLDAVFEAAQAGAAGRVCTADAVVADRQSQVTIDRVDRDRGLQGLYLDQQTAIEPWTFCVMTETPRDSFARMNLARNLS